jgi:hypothetical protein
LYIATELAARRVRFNWILLYPEPVYSQDVTVAPAPADMGPSALGPVTVSPTAAAASSLVKSEQASPCAGDPVAAGRNPDEKVIRVARMILLAEEVELGTLPPRLVGNR